MTANSTPTLRRTCPYHDSCNDVSLLVGGLCLNTQVAPIVNDIRALRLNKNDFNFIRRLAKGQFGEVSLVRGKMDNKVYALKALRKSEMLKQAEVLDELSRSLLLDCLLYGGTSSFSGDKV